MQEKIHMELEYLKLKFMRSPGQSSVHLLPSWVLLPLFFFIHHGFFSSSEFISSRGFFFLLQILQTVGSSSSDSSNLLLRLEFHVAKISMSTIRKPLRLEILHWTQAWKARDVTFHNSFKTLLTNEIVSIIMLEGKYPLLQFDTFMFPFVHNSVTKEIDQGKKNLEFIFVWGCHGCYFPAFVSFFLLLHEVTVSVTFSVNADNTKYFYYLLQLQQLFV